MGVGIMSAFFIIVCLCGLLLWTLKSVRVEPYILATGGINDQWRVVIPDTGTATLNMTDAQLFQQSLLWHFAQDWFTISPDHNINADIWNPDCKREQCLSDRVGTKNCAIYCSTGEELFYRFSKDILPQYQAYESMNATWMVVPRRIEPVGSISTKGGTWQIQLTILTGGTGAMDVIAYAKIEHNEKYFPNTRGYFIADFNAYRVSQ